MSGEGFEKTSPRLKLRASGETRERTTRVWVIGEVLSSEWPSEEYFSEIPSVVWDGWIEDKEGEGEGELERLVEGDAEREGVLKGAGDGRRRRQRKRGSRW